MLSGAAIEILPLGTKAKLLTKSLNKQQMQNCKTSARTAAQQSSKCSLLLRQAALAAILLLCAVACQNEKERTPEEVIQTQIDSLNVLHDKYRTLWYRTDKRCFYDSSRKYGLLLLEIYKIKEIDVFKIDTIPLKETGSCQ